MGIRRTGQRATPLGARSSSEIVTARDAYNTLGERLDSLVAKAGGTMTGQLVISKNYTYGDLTTVPLRIVGSDVTTPAGSYPLLELYNPDTNNDGEYGGECKLFFRAGNATTGNQRRYIHFREYDNTADNYIIGVNASNVRIEYDTGAAVHRVWWIQGGASYINAASAGDIKINYHGSDSVGTGGFSVYSGGAAATNTRIMALGNSTPGDANTATNFQINSGRTTGANAYLQFQDRGSTKYHFGKSSSNSFALYDYTNTKYMFVASTAGLAGIGELAPNAQLQITNASTTTRTLIAQAASSNARNIIEAKESSTVVFGVGVGGKMLTNQAAANTNTPSGSTAYQLPIYNTAAALLGYIPVYAAAW